MIHYIQMNKLWLLIFSIIIFFTQNYFFFFLLQTNKIRVGEIQT